MLRLISAILPLYVIIRLVLPLRTPVWIKALLALVIAICALKYPLFEFFYGTFTPPLPRWAMMVTGIAHGTIVLLTLLCLVRDLFLLGWQVARRFRPGLQRLTLSVGHWAVGLTSLALLLSCLAVWQGMRVPAVHHVSIELPRLPQELHGLRLVQLSDLHISPSFPRQWVQDVVDKSNALKPDIIVITGDLADGLPAALSDDLAPLRDLKAPLGVFSCPGNHEYYWGYAGWMQKIRELGITPLENSHTLLNVRGLPLAVAGVTDEAARRFGLPLPDVRQALSDTPKTALRLMLAHRPRLLYESRDAAVDLQLSGHTHGGQVLGLNALVAFFNDGFLNGLYRAGESLLYLSPGCALWPGFPLRLFVPSEITAITLHSTARVQHP